MADYDVIVAGAGPAGASAAYWLGEAGKRVLVLEKERLPRYKPCGGGLARSVLESFPFDLSPAVEREIGRVRFRFRDGREVAVGLPKQQPIGRVIQTPISDLDQQSLDLLYQGSFGLILVSDQRAAQFEESHSRNMHVFTPRD